LLKDEMLIPLIILNKRLSIWEPLF
jgi:hypothetical protein